MKVRVEYTLKWISVFFFREYIKMRVRWYGWRNKMTTHTHQHNDNENIVACQFTCYLLWKHLFFGIYKVTPTFSFKLNVDANFEKWYSAFCWQCVPYPLSTTEHQGGDEVSTQIFCFLTFPYLIFALRLVVLIYLIRLKIMACSFQILHI